MTTISAEAKNAARTIADQLLSDYGKEAWDEAVDQIEPTIQTALDAAKAQAAPVAPDGWTALVAQYKLLTAGKYKTAEIVDKESSFDCPMCEGAGCVDGEQYINFDGKPLNVLFSGIGKEFIGWQKLFDAFVAMLAVAPLKTEAEVRDAVVRNLFSKGRLDMTTTADTAPTKEQMLAWLYGAIFPKYLGTDEIRIRAAIRDVIAKSETPGWMYFNLSNEEWEWCAVRPAEDESDCIVAISKERFFERFPDHD